MRDYNEIQYSSEESDGKGLIRKLGKMRLSEMNFATKLNID